MATERQSVTDADNPRESVGDGIARAAIADADNPREPVGDAIARQAVGFGLPRAAVSDAIGRQDVAFADNPRISICSPPLFVEPVFCDGWASNVEFPSDWNTRDNIEILISDVPAGQVGDYFALDELWRLGTVTPNPAWPVPGEPASYGHEVLMRKGTFFGFEFYQFWLHLTFNNFPDWVTFNHLVVGLQPAGTVGLRMFEHRGRIQIVENDVILLDIEAGGGFDITTWSSEGNPKVKYGLDEAPGLPDANMTAQFEDTTCCVEQLPDL